LWNEDWQGKPKYSEKKPAPAPLCPPHNPTWLDPGLNPGRRVGKPATNRLSYGAAFFIQLLHTLWSTDHVLKLAVVYIPLSYSTMNRKMIM
jgi:hypothetical protein